MTGNDDHSELTETLIPSLGELMSKGHPIVINCKDLLRKELEKDVFTKRSFPILNLTITFDPYKFTDMDTIYEGPQQVQKVLSMKYRFWEKYYLISEKHKNGRIHLHGQMLIDPDVSRFDAYDNIVPFLKKKIGNITAKWNNINHIARDSIYTTYWDYCRKESSEYTVSFGMVQNYYKPRESWDI